MNGCEYKQVRVNRQPATGNAGSQMIAVESAYGLGTLFDAKKLVFGVWRQLRIRKKCVGSAGGKTRRNRSETNPSIKVLSPASWRVRRRPPRWLPAPRKDSARQQPRTPRTITSMQPTIHLESRPRSLRCRPLKGALLYVETDWHCR